MRSRPNEYFLHRTVLGPYVKNTTILATRKWETFPKHREPWKVTRIHIPENSNLYQHTCDNSNHASWRHICYWHSSVSIETDLWAGRSDFRFQAKVRGLFLLHKIHVGSGGSWASYSLSTVRVSSWVERPEPEADHSPPSSANYCVFYSAYKRSRKSIYERKQTSQVTWSCVCLFSQIKVLS
jgi:hypothetical protein